MLGQLCLRQYSLKDLVRFDCKIEEQPTSINRSIILSARGLSSRQLNDSASLTIRSYRSKNRAMLNLNNLILTHHINVETLDDPIYHISIPILYQ